MTKLRELERYRANGELIAAVDSIEVHVYLIAGKVAWATSSESSATLSQALLARCNLDREMLRRVVHDSRAAGKPLGEALVERGLATREQVRLALAEKIREVLRLLQAFCDARVVFVPCSLRYGDELTFALDDVLDDRGARASQQHREASRELVQQLWGALPNVSWIALRENGVPVASIGRPGIRLSLAELSGLWDVPLGPELPRVTVRGRHGSIIGQAMRDAPSTLWCGVEPSGNLGLASALLANWGPLETPGPRRSNPPPWRVWSEGDTPALPDAARAALSDLREIGALFALDGQGVCRWGVHRAGHGLEACALWAARRSALLDVSLEGCFAGRSATWDRIVGEPAAVLCERGEDMFFGRRVAADSSMRLWLVLERCAVRGLGWGLLDTISRELSAPRQRPRLRAP